MSLKGTWCSGITPAQHAGGPGFNPQRVHVLEAVTSKTCAGLKPRMWQQGGSAWQDASAGNRTRVTSMATMYSTTRPLMQDTSVLRNISIGIAQPSADLTGRPPQLFLRPTAGHKLGAPTNARGRQAGVGRACPRGGGGARTGEEGDLQRWPRGYTLVVRAELPTQKGKGHGPGARPQDERTAGDTSSQGPAGIPVA